MVDFFGRILRGKLVSFDPVKAKAIVRLVDTAREIECLLSYPFVSGESGIRFYPKGYEDVLVGFSPTGLARIIGFVHYENVLQVLNNDTDNLYFRKMKPGDISIRTGALGSEVLWTESGLELSSGVSYIRLDNVRRSIEQVAGMIRSSLLSGLKQSMGYVYRNIGDIGEQRIPGTVEYLLEVSKETGKVCGIKIGDIINDNGVIEIGDFGLEKRMSFEVYEGLIKIGEMYFDIGGNFKVSNNTNINMSSGYINLQSAGIDVNGGMIRLGGELAVFSLVRGEELVVILNSLLDNLIKALSALKPKDGQEAVVGEAITGLTALTTQLQNILSSTVKVK